MNATRLPSGAMSEKPASIGASVSRRWCEPSASMIQMAATSRPIWLSNMIRRPSGVYSGQKLSRDVRRQLVNRRARRGGHGGDHVQVRHVRLACEHQGGAVRRPMGRAVEPARIVGEPRQARAVDVHHEQLDIPADVVREHDAATVGRDVGQERVGGRGGVAGGERGDLRDAAPVRPDGMQLPAAARFDETTMRPFLPGNVADAGAAATARTTSARSRDRMVPPRPRVTSWDSARVRLDLRDVAAVGAHDVHVRVAEVGMDPFEDQPIAVGRPRRPDVVLARRVHQLCEALAD